MNTGAALVLMEEMYRTCRTQGEETTEGEGAEEKGTEQEKRLRLGKHVFPDKATSASFPSVQQSEQCATLCGGRHA